MLAPLSELRFDPENHDYFVHDIKLQGSVTEVCSKPSQRAIETFNKTRHIWEPRGNSVHDALECFLLGKEVEMPFAYEDWIEPLLNHSFFNDVEVLAAEYRLYDIERRLGGSLDFLIKTKKGGIIVGDLKTVGKTKGAAKKRASAKAQLGAYSRMLMQHKLVPFVDQCVTVISAPDEVVIRENLVSDCITSWDKALKSWDEHLILQGID